MTYIVIGAFGKPYFERDQFGNESTAIPYMQWKMLRNTLAEELGVFQLSKEGRLGMQKDCLQFFLNESSTENALNFIDLALQIVNLSVRPLFQRTLGSTDEFSLELSPDEAIEEANVRLDQHHLGYQFVDGMLIRRDSQFTHAEITLPAFSLLGESGFGGPNEEFHRAHRAYLSGNERETIRECLNAFESTLKAICTKRRWPYDPQKDTASKLVAIVFEKGLIPPYLQQEFRSLRAMLEAGVPTVRNRAGGHGQGPELVDVPKHLAAYALHITASSILLLVQADKAL